MRALARTAVMLFKCTLIFTFVSCNESPTGPTEKS